MKKTHNVQRNGTRKGGFRRKKELALALCVALWLAGGSVEGAKALYIDSSGAAHPASGYPGATVTVTDNNKTLNVSGGKWGTEWTRFKAGNNKLSGYTLNMSNATFKCDGVTLYGSDYTNNGGIKPIQNNAVVISDSKFTDKATVYGAYGRYEGGSGTSQYNELIGNTVTIAGSAAKGTNFLKAATIYAAYDKASSELVDNNKAYNNTVNLYGTTAMENVSLFGWGSSTDRMYIHRDNELHLGGTRTTEQIVPGVALAPWQGYALDNAGNFTTVNNTVKQVDRFNKIVLHQVNWSTTVPVLKATSGFTNSGALDISAMTFANADTFNAVTSGTMTLLEGAASNFSALKLSYNDATKTNPATLNGTNQGVVIQAATTGSNTLSGVTLNYRTGAHTVFLADNFSKVNYTIHDGNYVDTISLGTVAWNRNGTVLTLAAGSGYTFDEGTAISSFSFDTPQSIGVGDSMTLLGGATGLTGTNIAHTQDFTQTASGATLTATLSGNVTRTANTLGYTATGTALTGVNLANWNGTAAAVPTGWTSGLAANSITATDFTAPTATTDILTTNTDNFFSDAYITGALKYDASSTFTSAANGVTISGGAARGVKASTDGKKLTYCVDGATGVTVISLGEMTWGTGRNASGTGYDFTNVATVNATNLVFSNPEAATGNMTLLSGATNLTADKTVTGAAHSQDFSATMSGATLSGTLSGTVATTAGAVNYTFGSKKLTGVNLTNWNGTTVALTGWTSNLAANAITAAGFTAPTLAAGGEKEILTTTTASFFNDNYITGALKYAADTESSDTVNGVTLTGAESRGVKASADGKRLVYARSDFAVSDITLGEMTWGTARDASAAGYDFTNATVNAAGLSFKNPETIAAGSTTLLTANATLADMAAQEKNLAYTYAPVAGVTLTGTVNGSLAASGGAVTYTATANKADKLAFGAVEWKDSGALIDHASALTNVTFDGAAVDTSQISFTNVNRLDAGKAMTLVSSFGNTVGTITGDTYRIGTTLQGKGKASLNGTNLIYTVETASVAPTHTPTPNPDPDPEPTPSPTPTPSPNGTGGNANNGTAKNGGTANNGANNSANTNRNANANRNANTNNSGNLFSGGNSHGGNANGANGGNGGGNGSSSGGRPALEAQPQTHNTVMGAEVSMAALSAGNDFVGAATEGLALAANVGADGVSSYANMGGGSLRQETGSHVDAHTWNAIIALGHQNKKQSGTFEYGAFFEYGRGNYTTYNDEGQRGDGSTHYTGGGLLAKWTAKHGFYVEGSLRAGRVHDDARSVLRDAVGNPYSYTTNAPYMGFHLGVGKVIEFDDIHSLDVYGKYYFNRRRGVSFDAGGHYDLDAVTSQMIRLGARYTVKQDKWSLYGGLAYEHELDGKATGRADGYAIEGADTSGGSVRGEIGATMKPGENSPILLDLNLSAFAGKKRGFTGGVSVVFML